MSSFRLQNHFLYRGHQYSLGTQFLQSSDNLPETTLVEHRVHTAPLLISQRNDGGTLQTRKHLDNLVEAGAGYVHPDIFLVLGLTDGTDAEQQFLQGGAFLFAQLLVADQQGLALINISTSRRLLLTKVEPLLTMSKIPSARPIPGEISTLPVMT